MAGLLTYGSPYSLFLLEHYWSNGPVKLSYPITVVGAVTDSHRIPYYLFLQLQKSTILVSDYI